jgi:hypothetical protein
MDDFLPTNKRTRQIPIQQIEITNSENEIPNDIMEVQARVNTGDTSHPPSMITKNNRSDQQTNAT